MLLLRSCALVLGLAISVPCSAAIVSLDLQVNSSANTFSVFATIDDPTSNGLASFSLDVIGADGASVLSRSLQAPRIFDPLVGDSGEFTGFSEFRSSGVLSAVSVVGMTASQGHDLVTCRRSHHHRFRCGVARVAGDRHIWWA